MYKVKNISTGEELEVEVLSEEILAAQTAGEVTVEEVT